MFPELLSPLKEEFKSWHEKLSHFHTKSMFRLAKIGVLPSRFIYLKYDLPLCAPCMFVTASKRQCRTKGNKSVSIRKETDNNPGAAVSLDQLHSAKSGLVPQLSIKLTSARIWDVQVMVDHFGDLTYVNLMRSKIQEETFLGQENPGADIPGCGSRTARGSTGRGMIDMARVKNSFGHPAWEVNLDERWRPAGGSDVQVDGQSATGRERGGKKLLQIEREAASKGGRWGAIRDRSERREKRNEQYIKRQKKFWGRGIY